MISFRNKILIFASLWSMQLLSVPANTVVATINVGITPVGIAVTSNGKYVYVANENNYEITNQDTVSLIDGTKNVLIKDIADASFSGPYAIAINPANTVVYVTNGNTTTISMISTASNTVTGVITGLDGPSGMVISPNGTTAYVNNYGSGVGTGSGTTVRVIDLNSNTVTGPAITVGLAPAALAITPDGAYVYCSNYVDGNVGTGTVSVIQTSNNTVVDTITGFSGPYAIAITPNGKYAYVTNFGSNDFAPFGTTISVISTATNTIVDTILLGIQPSGIAITSDGLFAYASNYNTLYAGASFTNLTAGEGTVNIIDIATNSLVAPNIAVGNSPVSITISPNGQYAYVSNFLGNSVSVIALQSFQIVAQACRMQNQYLTQIDLMNKITWTVSGKSLPVEYAIYRDLQLTDLVGTVSANEPFEFLDHNRIAGVIDTYYIIGVNAVGTTSDPVSVTVTHQC